MKTLAATLAIVVLTSALAGFLIFAPPLGPRSMRDFDAPRMADLELRMWKAYYAKERVRLFALLVTMLHEQYHYSWARAATEGFHLARAAATFGDLKGGYDIALPDLEEAYAQARAWLGAGYEPRDVARAELAWWVARRIPGQNSPEQVGDLMAEEYALLYETSREAMARAAFLRAEAGWLRDRDAAQPDWDSIQGLLLASYRELYVALHSRSAGQRGVGAPVPGCVAGFWNTRCSKDLRTGAVGCPETAAVLVFRPEFAGSSTGWPVRWRRQNS